MSQDYIFEIIKIGGGFAGFVALCWLIIDEFGSYLRISVNVTQPENGWITVQSSVENKGLRAKKISYACLIVGPEDEGPIDTARILAKHCEYTGRLKFTNDLEHFRVVRPMYFGGRGIIPLPFYYDENVDVVDETLTYRAPIPAGELEEGIPYGVRFFLFAPNRLHRSTQDAFINIQSQSKGAEAA